ncbi:MAG TPA: chemotaxis protein CheB [Streptosporangiaceae bacterium]
MGISSGEDAHRDTVVVAASAGGITALRRLLAALPPDLPATVLGVVHLPAAGNSVLPNVLGRGSSLLVEFGRDRATPRYGRMYVAPADRHLLLRGDELRLSGGPRQNGVRPAADPLFFSAALARGRRVLAVVLSGMLDDGAAGCATVEARGGSVAVQDPDEADYDGMPAAALAATTKAFCGGIEEIARFVVEETRGALMGDETNRAFEPDVELERLIAGLLVPEDAESDPPASDFVQLTCPDCGGPLYSRSMPGGQPRLECMIGHGWSPQTLLESHGVMVERALSMAIVQLTERANLTRRLAVSAGERGHRLSAAMFEDKTRQADEAVVALRRLLDELIGQETGRGR